jgi:excisionase family DNA binding protein
VEHVEQPDLNILEAAEKLRVHRDTLYTLVKRKQIPHYKVGRQIFFRPESLEKWKLSMEQQSVAHG